MPKRNILKLIDSLTEDRIFPPSHNLALTRISKGFAPLLTEVLEDYIEQNAGSGTPYRVRRLEAAKRMLGAE